MLFRTRELENGKEKMHEQEREINRIYNRVRVAYSQVMLVNRKGTHYGYQIAHGTYLDGMEVKSYVICIERHSGGMEGEVR